MQPHVDPFLITVFKELRQFWSLTLSETPGIAQKPVLTFLSVLIQSGSESHASFSFQGLSPIVQKSCRSLGMALSCSMAYYFSLGALLTWIQLYVFLNAAGIFVLARAKHELRAFLTLSTRSHHYIFQVRAAYLHDS